LRVEEWASPQERARETLFSFLPACSSFDQLRNGQQSGAALGHVVKSMGGGAPGCSPYINGKRADDLNADPIRSGRATFDLEFLEGKLQFTELTIPQRKDAIRANKNE
jgi:hypothetical protein